MQITDLRSIVTDVRRLTLQIINGRETVVFETSARDGNKYSLLPLSRFTLQKLKNTEGGVVGTGLVDSTTNVFLANAEKSEEKDKSLPGTSQTVTSVVEEDKQDEKNKTKDKHAVNANEREETIDSVSNAPSAPQSITAKSGFSDAIEESGDSVASNQYDKIAIRDIRRESNVSDSIVEKTDMKQKKSDVESEQFSNDAIALKQNCQSVENAAKEEEKSNSEKSRAFERIIDNDQSNSSIPPELASERSEESNEASIEQKSSLERTSISTFSFNKATAKGGEPSKKLRRKHSGSTPIRRSTRNSNENIKSSKINEADANSNNSEQEPSVLHERDLTMRSRSRSPTWATRDERIANNVKKNRVSQKVQNANSGKVGAESETKIEDLNIIADSAVLKNRTVDRTTRKRKQHTEWQMKNCKVRLIDCKPDLLKNFNPKVLDRFGINAANPCAASDSSCIQRITGNQNTAMIPTAASDKSFFISDKSCDKEKPEIEILEEKPIKENSDKDITQESVSHAAEIDEEDSARMQYTVHKGPILDIKV